MLIRADLANLPQVPQTGFILGFNRSPNALLKTPPTCGTKYGLGAFFPYSLGQYKVNFAPASVTRQASGAPCSAAAVARVSKPKLSASLTR